MLFTLKSDSWQKESAILQRYKALPLFHWIPAKSGNDNVRELTYIVVMLYFSEVKIWLLFVSCTPQILILDKLR